MSIYTNLYVGWSAQKKSNEKKLFKYEKDIEY